MTIKKNVQIFPVESRGIDFLGYVIRHDYIRLRKTIKTKALKHLKKVKSVNRLKAILGAFYGWAKHSNHIHLFETIIKNDKKIYKIYKEMKFKDMKLNLTKNYGDKKVFDCDQVPLSDLVNMEIEILDFETNVKTSYGDNRCVVKFKMDGAEKKYITSSSKMIQELEAIKEQYGFPFEATIKKHKFANGNYRYVFV